MTGPDLVKSSAADIMVQSLAAVVVAQYEDLSLIGPNMSAWDTLHGSMERATFALIPASHNKLRVQVIHR
jgi:hypothetical protein